MGLIHKSRKSQSLKRKVLGEIIGRHGNSLVAPEQRLYTAEYFFSFRPIYFNLIRVKDTSQNKAVGFQGFRGKESPPRKNPLYLGNNPLVPRTPLSNSNSSPRAVRQQFPTRLECADQTHGSLRRMRFQGVKHFTVVAWQQLSKHPPLCRLSLPNGRSATMTSDLVAYWDVPLSDKLHRIEFEHGTTTGKRVIRLDGEVILKRDWMFKLVGCEVFNVGKAKCVIRVDPVGGFSYSYSLTVNGKSFNTFAEIQSKALKTWIVHFDDDTYRVVLEKDTLDIWANGEKLDVAGEFVENGTETHFTLGEWPACIKAVTSGNRREGIIHHLIVNDKIVPETVE